MSGGVFTCGADYGKTMAFLKNFLLMNSWVQLIVNQFSACNNFNNDLYEQIIHEGVTILFTIWNHILITRNNCGF